MSRLLVTLSLAAIAVATLSPASGPAPATGVLCVLCGELGTPDLLVNLLLFAPLGLGLALSGVSLRRIVVICIALSAGIELVQLLLPGRAPTLRDVLANGVGGGLGAALKLYLPALLRPAPRTTRLAWIAALAPAVIVGGSGLLRAYDVPAADYFLMVTPRQPHLARWDGKVDAVTLNGERLTPGPQGNQPAIREALLAGAEFEVSGVAGPTAPRLAGIVAIADDWPRQMLLIGLDGDDLVIFTRRLASTFRFAEPPTRFPGALRGLAPGDSFDIRVSGPADSVCAWVGGVGRCAGAAAAGSYWQLIRPLDDATVATRRTLDAVGVALLLIPLGLLLPALRRRQRVAVVLAASGAFAISALASGLDLPRAAEWGGLLTGLLLGSLSHRVVRGE
ncbi:MAG: VanZ family protein [Gemmatimonadaceae bacterium]|nr:VanZ family protein [Gemmatimonadaceae bacterium]